MRIFLQSPLTHMSVCTFQHYVAFTNVCLLHDFNSETVMPLLLLLLSRIVFSIKLKNTVGIFIEIILNYLSIFIVQSFWSGKGDIFTFSNVLFDDVLVLSNVIFVVDFFHFLGLTYTYLIFSVIVCIAHFPKIFLVVHY